ERLGLQEDVHKSTILQQHNVPQRRSISKEHIGDPVIRGNKSLLCGRIGNLSVVGSEASGLYGHPIEQFSRFWITCGAHAVFIVDVIKSAEPVITTWNWLINNRDDKTTVYKTSDTGLEIKRPKAGLKMLSSGNVK